MQSDTSAPKETHMPKINWTRLIVGGLVASIIMFVTDGFFHEQIVKADWRAVYAALKATEPEPHGMEPGLLCSF